MALRAPSFAKLYAAHILQQSGTAIRIQADEKLFGASHWKALEMKREFGSSWIMAGLFAATAATAGLAGAGLAKGGPAHGGMHSMSGHMKATDPAAIDAHIDKMLAQMLPDSTLEQKTRLKALARAVHGDLDTVHAQFQQTHQRAHALLLGPVIDRSALEALRVAQIRQIDTVSKQLFDELADAAEVLTPEQRARLAARHQGH